MTTSQVKQSLLRTLDELSEERLEQLAQYAEILKRDEFVEFDQWAARVARQKGFSHLTEDEVARIVEEMRRERK